MPIRPEMKKRYPPPAEWKKIQDRIRERSFNRCECRGQCGAPHPDGRCNAPNHTHVQRLPSFPWIWIPQKMRLYPKIVLTVAHYPDPAPENCADSNLIHMCQYCHNRLDAPMRQANARKTRRARHAAAHASLFAPETQEAGDVPPASPEPPQTPPA